MSRTPEARGGCEFRNALLTRRLVNKKYLTSVARPPEPEHGTVLVRAVAGGLEVIVDQRVGPRVQRCNGK
jgi:hypothetical protein